MREKLAEIEGKRCTFVGRFSRFGQRRGWRGRAFVTTLLVDIRNIQGHLICDHIWLTQYKQLEALCLQQGDQVEFVATVKRYEKGYRGHRVDVDCPIGEDFGLSRPAQYCVRNRRPVQQTPLFDMPEAK